MIAKKNTVENPAGPDQPTFRFPFSRLQVVIGLLLIAAGLTVWRQIQIRFVAPATPVVWQPIQPDLLESSLRHRRPVLIYLVPDSVDQANRIELAMDNPEFRRQVWLQGALAMSGSCTELQPSDLPHLDPPLDIDQLREQGGLVWFDTGPGGLSRVSVLTIDRISPASVTALLEGQVD